MHAKEITGLPLILFTLGDVAGIGPEIIVKAWPELKRLCRPVVVGDPGWLRRAADLVGSRLKVISVGHPAGKVPGEDDLFCLVCPTAALEKVQPGRVSAAAGRAAFDFLCAAIDHTLAGEADAIVTAPLHKEGLRAAGIVHPGHTEILAERTGVRHFGMVLYLDGLAVVHVTLHMALRDVFRYLSAQAVFEKAQLLSELQGNLLGRPPRIGVAALNPHAGDGGLFGDEEDKMIRPGVEAAQRAGILASGPWPSDTLFRRARDGEFDGVVAMYHDQGHIALKGQGGLRAVNISAGLPLVRTSVAHGTAYDIAGRGLADPTSLVEATRVAARLVVRRPRQHE